MLKPGDEDENDTSYLDDVEVDPEVEKALAENMAEMFKK